MRKNDVNGVIDGLLKDNLLKKEFKNPLKKEKVERFIEKTKTVLFSEFYIKGGAFFKFRLRLELSKLSRDLIKILRVQKEMERRLGNRELGNILERDRVFEFVNFLPNLKKYMLSTACRGFLVDPSPTSQGEIILCYSTFDTVLYYKIGNFFWERGFRLLGRLICEIAHSKTSVDIHPGAKIGEGIFIDHGVGVVIGETATVGKNVTLYHGVTLGAKTVKRGKGLKNEKRHPTLEDGVTLYFNSSVLGGETVVGENSTVFRGASVLNSIPKGSKVSAKNQEISILQKP